MWNYLVDAIKANPGKIWVAAWFIFMAIVANLPHPDDPKRPLRDAAYRFLYGFLNTLAITKGKYVPPLPQSQYNLGGYKDVETKK